MKANEFVRENGLYAFKHALAQLSFKPKMFLIVYQYECEFVHEIKPNHGNCVFGYDDVKRLVESHELVVQCGGLEDARSHLESIRFNIATKTWFGQALLNRSMYADKLEKAIADVESCMEVKGEN